MHRCNSQSIKHLHENVLKGAYFEFKRALVSTQKGIFCKPIKRLFEAKRASFQNECVKNNYILYKEELCRQRKVQMFFYVLYERISVLNIVKR